MPDGFVWKELQVRTADSKAVTGDQLDGVGAALKKAQAIVAAAKPPLTGRLPSCLVRVNFDENLAGKDSEQVEALAGQIAFAVIQASPYTGVLGGVSSTITALQQRFHLGGHYEGEGIEDKNRWWGPLSTNRRVEYFWTEADRKGNEFAVDPSSKKLIFANKKAPTGESLAVDTSGMSSIWGEEVRERGLFVMSPDGHLYMGKGEAFQFHHSSFMAGGDVLVAGEIEVTDGVLKTISNTSGHYRPKPDSLLVALRTLERRGLDISAVKVQPTAADTDPLFPPNILAPQFPKELGNWYDKKAIQAGDQAADATGWEEAVQYGKRARELGSTLDNFHVRVGEDVTGWKMDSAAKLGLIALDAGRDTPGGPFTAIATAKAILNGPSTMSSLWWLERARRCLLLFDDSALSAAHPSLKEGKYELWSYLRSWLGMTGGDPSSMSETAPSAAEATGSLIPSAEEFSPASPPAPAHQSAGPAMVLVEEEETSPSRKPSHYEVDKSVESHTYYRPK